MQLTKTQLPDERVYETFDSETERNVRYNELKRIKWKVDTGKYQSVNWRIYFLIYKE